MLSTVFLASRGGSKVHGVECGQRPRELAPSPLILSLGGERKITVRGFHRPQATHKAKTKEDLATMCPILFFIPVSSILSSYTEGQISFNRLSRS
jgi:hypothetical protein